MHIHIKPFRFIFSNKTQNRNKEGSVKNKPKILLHFDSNPQNLDQFGLFSSSAPIPIQFTIILLVGYSRSSIRFTFYPTPIFHTFFLSFSPCVHYLVLSMHTVICISELIISFLIPFAIEGNKQCLPNDLGKAMLRLGGPESA